MAQSELERKYEELHKKCDNVNHSLNSAISVVSTLKQLKSECDEEFRVAFELVEEERMQKMAMLVAHEDSISDPEWFINGESQGKKR